LNTAAASRSRPSVLVIDDEPMVGAAIARLLRNDHQVQVVTSAGEALARCAEPASFDVILCDLMMPGMTGPEFFQEILRICPSLARRIVFMTGGAFTPEARKFVSEVANQIVEKPFDRQVLLEAIGKCHAAGDTVAHSSEQATRNAGYGSEPQ
jgi:CheY-like chemotaxis protein